MLKLEELLNEIENYELVKRFKELDALLSTNEYYIETMNRLKNLQREIVQKKSINLDYIPTEVEYNKLMTEFTENPIIAEYLEVKQQLNQLLAEIQAIFSSQQR